MLSYCSLFCSVLNLEQLQNQHRALYQQASQYFSKQQYAEAEATLQSLVQHDLYTNLFTTPPAALLTQENIPSRTLLQLLYRSYKLLAQCCVKTSRHADAVSHYLTASRIPFAILFTTEDGGLLDEKQYKARVMKSELTCAESK